MAIASTNKIVLSGPIIAVAVASIIVAITFENGFYLLSCLLTLYGILLLLWRQNRPGILVFAFLMQWTQVFAYVIWMNVMGWDIDRLSPHGGIAVMMACLGIITMAGVLSLVIRPMPIPTRQQFIEQARLINERKILILYLFSTLFLGGLGFIVGGNSGLAQILLTLSSLKWVFFLVYAYVSWLNKKNRLILGVIILFEFSTALYSYFSSFKEVILFTIILALTFVRKISFKQFLYGILVILFLGFLLITWTAIKSDYRNYLNGGTRQQVIEVSRGDAFSKISEKIGNIGWKDYQQAMVMFLYRVQYIYHLAKTMDRVPEILPHEGGGLWWENISFVLVPRLFYPEKPIYEATKKTAKYTGIHYAGLRQGASFSLGYYADCYIDFGYTGMLFPLVLIALFVAFIYRSFYKLTKLNILFRFALINVSLFEYTSFEADGLFLFGRLLLMFLVFYTLSRTVLNPLQKWLYKAK